VPSDPQEAKALNAILEYPRWRFGALEDITIYFADVKVELIVT
jgi:hypothetical protein